MCNWISVEDELPKFDRGYLEDMPGGDTPYLVWMHRDGNKPGFNKAIYTPEGWRSYVLNVWLTDVTHWAIIEGPGT